MNQIRILLAAAILLSPSMTSAGHGGGRCYPTYCKPVVAAPVVKAYPTTNNTVTYTYNIVQAPAQQGQTAYGLQAAFSTYQQTDLAIPATIALAQRHSEASVQIAGIAGQAQQLAASNQAQSLANQSQALRIAETQVNAQTVERVMAAIRPPPQQTQVIYQQQQGGYQPNGNGYYAQQQQASLLGQFCATCHSGPAAKGNPPLVISQENARELEARYFRVGMRVSNKTMPPADAPQPTDEQRQGIIAELRQLIMGAQNVQPQYQQQPTLQQQAPPAPEPQIQPQGGW